MYPASDGLLVALQGAARGLLRTPIQLVQQAPDVIDVIAHTKTPLDELGHPWAGPQIGVKSSGLRPLEQQRFEPMLVFGTQLGRATGRGLGTHTRRAASIGRPLPAPHTTPIDPDAPRYLKGHQSFLEQRQRSHASAFQFLWASGGPHGAPPDQSIGHSLRRYQ